MRFGIDLPNYGIFGDPALLVELAVEAEAAGWDGFFLWDHMVADGGVPVTDPWVVMSAAATRTSNLFLGPMVTPLARRRMTKLARETVALDHLSGGRLIMGVGLGAHDEAEFSAFGDAGDRRERGEILDESLQLLDRLWSGEAVDFQGHHLRAVTGPFLPRPLQQPRIPVWVAGLWPNKNPMRRAAAWDGAFPIDRGGDLTMQLSLSDMADAIAFVRERRTGDGPYDVVHAGLMSGDHAADTKLATAYAEIGVTWWLEHFYPERMTIEAVQELIGKGPPRPR